MMNKINKKHTIIKKNVKKLMNFLPVTLPQTGAEFDEFCTSILETYGFDDNPSYRHAIATMIMHQGPTISRKPKHYFAVAVKKAIANQVAYEKIQSLKKLEEEYIQKTLHKPVDQIAEATTSNELSESHDGSLVQG